MNISSTRSHFAALDGLRGFAAVLVVLYHLNHWLGIPWLVANGGLSVDFFFCLSGFVIAGAYGVKSGRTLSFSSFLAIRLTRLLPAIWLATTLSAIYVASRLVFKADQPVPISLAYAVVLGLASIPYVGAPAAIGGPQIFPLNGPQYSLFLELVVNVAWFGLRHSVGLRSSVAICVTCYAVLAFTGFGGDTSHDMVSGLPRVFGSFFLGVAVFYLRPLFLSAEIRPRSVGLCFLAATAIFFALSCYPHVLTFLAVLSATALLCPAIVLAGSLWTPPPRLESIATFLGEISYPMYALHYPLFCWLNGSLQSAHLTHGVAELVVCLAGIFALSGVLLRSYDTPARRYISSVMKRRSAAAQTTAEVRLLDVGYGPAHESITRLKTLT